MKTYKSIRIANDILERAERYQIEDYFLIEMCDRWLNGEFTDEMLEQYPEIASVMGDLENKYTPTDLNRAFELLQECEA